MNRKERDRANLVAILYSINQSKHNLMHDGSYEREHYKPYIVNKALSQHLDSVLSKLWSSISDLYLFPSLSTNSQNTLVSNPS